MDFLNHFLNHNHPFANLPEYQQFEAQDIHIEINFNKITIPAQQVARRQSGKIELKRSNIFYKFGIDETDGAYVEVSEIFHNGVLPKIQRHFASGLMVHMPPAPGWGVCMHCGDSLKGGGDMCTECCADIIAYGLGYHQIQRELDKNYLDLAQVPEKERGMLIYLRWKLRGKLSSIIKEIYVELTPEEPIFWVYTVCEFKKDHAEDFIKYLDVALVYSPPEDQMGQAYRDLNRQVMDEVAGCGVSPESFPRHAKVIFLYRNPAIKKGWRIYKRSDIKD